MLVSISKVGFLVVALNSLTAVPFSCLSVRLSAAPTAASAVGIQGAPKEQQEASMAMVRFLA